ncbi:endonuclease/exonuclease/phosphatase family protein [Citricoccus muralis]|uniref:endonuclease/exonuclease/phosphatase family protein n=1 Tax=Citricoccus muralis TaxID=169134 RepID=UPI0014757BAA|nr:endonuclease/exonuclease/phosphatase family protein [Citricoccus muralis]
MAGPHGSRRRRLRRAVLVTCVVLAVLLAVLPHPAITRPWIMPALQSLVPVLSVAAGVIAVLVLVFRQWWAAGVLAAGAVLALLPAVVPLGPPGTEAGPEPGTLTVLSLNAEYAGVDAEALAAAVGAGGAGDDRGAHGSDGVGGVDVLVLVEADEDLLTALQELGALDGLPYRTEVIPEEPQGGTAGGAVILSAHPLRSEGVLPRFATHRHFEQPVAVVEHPELGAVRVVGIHPVPPIGDDFVPSWDATLRGLDGWQAAQDDLPLVLAGDFNASQAHPQFRDLAEGFTPAAAAAGPLPGPTWPVGSWVPPFTAIDHVLLRGLTPVDYARLDFPGTDHRGILTTVRAQPESG